MSYSRIVIAAAAVLLFLLAPLSGSTATEEATSATPPPALTGVDWNLVELRGQVLGGEIPATIRFEADGSLGGYDGCNLYRGSYSLKAERIRIAQELLSTRIACPQPLAGRVLSFSAALGRASTYALEDGKLVLRGKGRARLAVFESKSGGIAESPRSDRA